MTLSSGYMIGYRQQLVGYALGLSKVLTPQLTKKLDQQSLADNACKLMTMVQGYTSLTFG